MVNILIYWGSGVWEGTHIEAGPSWGSISSPGGRGKLDASPGYVGEVIGSASLWRCWVTELFAVGIPILVRVNSQTADQSASLFSNES